MESIILGGGTTGLVLLELLKKDGFKMITKEIGGESASFFNLGPRILQYSPIVEKFLKSIGINEPAKIFKVGYKSYGKLLETFPPELRQVYFEKTRGVVLNRNDSCLSEGKNEIKGWDMRGINLAKVLKERNKHLIEFNTINQIMPESSKFGVKFGGPELREYKKMISTIDSKDLFTIMGESKNKSFKKKVVFYTLILDSDSEFEVGDFDYVYDLTHENINRITRFASNIKIVESNEKLEIAENSRVIKLGQEVRQSQIQEELKQNEYKGIQLAGRFAQYNHSIKLNNIIEEYMEGGTEMKEMKIAIIDIDGVLNYHPDCFVEYVNEYLSKDYVDLEAVKNSLSYNKYREVKYIYRTSGFKENLKVRSDSKEALKELKKLGYYIIILSARPIEEVNSLIMQTTNWLKDNEIEYDYLMFGRNKYLEIIQKFGNVQFVVEDDRGFANDIARHGYKVFLLDNKHNKGKLVFGVQRIQSVLEITEKLKMNSKGEL